MNLNLKEGETLQKLKKEKRHGYLHQGKGRPSPAQGGRKGESASNKEKNPPFVLNKACAISGTSSAHHVETMPDSLVYKLGEKTEDKGTIEARGGEDGPSPHA